MTYYDDLSPYVYVDDHEPMLNVGWLEIGHSFDHGDVSADVVAILLRLAGQPANVMRGMHDCKFCEVESPIRMLAPIGRGHVSLGTGEIHVRGADGVVFSAPTLIIHYIVEHGYRPPNEFLDAVLLTASNAAGE